MSDEEPYESDNITHVGPGGSFRILTHRYVSIVCWSEIVGCGAMWDMRDEDHEMVVARCKTYEDAVEAALPYCREKTAFMQTHGYNKSAHAVIKVKHWWKIEAIKGNEHEVEE